MHPIQRPRTKIVATVGPATDSPEVMRSLIQAGATTLRLNFSHGTHADHLRRIHQIRTLEQELGYPVAILQDLQGPKIRLGKFAGGPIQLANGEPFTLTSRPVVCDRTIATVTYDKLAEEVPQGATILLDDGRVEMVVETVDTANEALHCRVVCGGKLSDNKGVNFPDVFLSIRALTPKDREDLVFGLKHGADWVALSFVRNAEDVLELKALMKQLGRMVPVISKIEKHEAMKVIEEIVAVSDGIMVARGDLGVEMPAEQVPLLQKRLIRLANAAGKPVITATQMLDSMVSAPRPTRAEVSDVANAILDGTDAVMLSNETAVGSFPVDAVATMIRIACTTESAYVRPDHQDLEPSITNAISQAVARIGEQLQVQAIVTLTKSGATGRNVSKFRPSVPILAVTPTQEVARQLQVVWGVYPLVTLDRPSTRQTFQSALAVALAEKLIEEGDLVVMTAGTLTGISGSTDLLKVEVVTSVLGRGQGIGTQMVTGRARVVTPTTLGTVEPSDILVTQCTNADFIEAIRKCAGVVTEQDGFNSHAAVIATRLGIPVLVGVANATQRIHDGSILTLDPKQGIVYSGSPLAN
ncbi:pyruvate kinase [Candidatus Cyanaurora vandensis]|uniref:pyruvate kinase n=1 Tax=Candidatus Cyanaurora vandensis TaxID=2714958 RepID=UPI00257A8B74|nr:pyruvate kinase [Candidatus Cyanaurora vandensis]